MKHHTPQVCEMFKEIQFRWGKTEAYVDLLMVSFTEYLVSDHYADLDREQREQVVHDMNHIREIIQILGKETGN